MDPDFVIHEDDRNDQVCSIRQYEPIRYHEVILSATPGKEWARAYDIPTVSANFVQFKKYILLKNSCKN
jgi:hypothetical protein